MDIDNSRVTWDLDKTCKASNVSMLTGTASSLPPSSLLHRLRPAQIDSSGTGVRLQSNNEPRVLSAFHSGDRIEYTKSDPMGVQFSFAKVLERNSSTRAVQHAVHASFHGGITLSLAVCMHECKHPLAPSIFWSSQIQHRAFHPSTRNHACVP
jgi:hypothetical protein